MSLLTDLQERVIAFKAQLDAGTLVQSIVLDNEAFICDLNGQEQLYEQGVNNLGVDISDYAPYSDTTIEIKKLKGQPYDRVTLRDTGDFEGSFFIQADLEKFEIKASDWKTEELVKKYGRQILGLTDESKNIVSWDILYKPLLEKAKEIIYG